MSAVFLSLPFHRHSNSTWGTRLGRLGSKCFFGECAVLNWHGHVGPWVNRRTVLARSTCSFHVLQKGASSATSPDVVTLPPVVMTCVWPSLLNSVLCWYTWPLRPFSPSFVSLVRAHTHWLLQTSSTSFEKNCPSSKSSARELRPGFHSTKAFYNSCGRRGGTTAPMAAPKWSQRTTLLEVRLPLVLQQRLPASGVLLLWAR